MDHEDRVQMVKRAINLIDHVGNGAERYPGGKPKNCKFSFIFHPRDDQRNFMGFRCYVHDTENTVYLRHNIGDIKYGLGKDPYELSLCDPEFNTKFADFCNTKDKLVGVVHRMRRIEAEKEAQQSLIRKMSYLMYHAATGRTEPDKISSMIHKFLKNNSKHFWDYECFIEKPLLIEKFMKCDWFEALEGEQ